MCMRIKNENVSSPKHLLNHLRCIFILLLSRLGRLLGHLGVHLQVILVLFSKQLKKDVL